MWSQDWRWHERVSIFQDGHPGGQRAAERRGDDLPQRLRFVQQDVFNEKGRGSLRGRRRRVIQTHDFRFECVFQLLPMNPRASEQRHHVIYMCGRAHLQQVFIQTVERIGRID